MSISQPEFDEYIFQSTVFLFGAQQKKVIVIRCWVFLLESAALRVSLYHETFESKFGCCYNAIGARKRTEYETKRGIMCNVPRFTCSENKMLCGAQQSQQRVHFEHSRTFSLLDGRKNRATFRTLLLTTWCFVCCLLHTCYDRCNVFLFKNRKRFRNHPLSIENRNV